MPTVMANGINMYYEIHGSGEWIVLIAGLGTDSSIFRQYIDKLAKKYKVLIFDNRGVGKTDKPDIPYNIQTMADDTLSLLDALGIGEAYVLGVSLGGRIAMELTLSHPEKVKKLMLVSTAPSVQVKLSIFPKIIKYIRSLNKSEQPYYAFISQLKASSGYDCTERLKEIKIPTLIAYGRKDKQITKEQIDEMREKIKYSNLVEFNGGHLFFIFNSEQFTKEILNYLS